MSKPCGCKIVSAKQGRYTAIVYRPLHAAAPIGAEPADLMLAGVVAKLTGPMMIVNSDLEVDVMPSKKEWQAIVTKAREFQAKAEGKE